jgi:hypothetical protein
MAQQVVSSIVGAVGVGTHRKHGCGAPAGGPGAAVSN